MTEAQIHRAIMQYLRLALPRALVVHVANEVDANGKDIAIAISKAKSLGMMPGFPDIMVLTYAPAGPMFFEVKSKTGRLSVSQEAVRDHITELGHRYAVVRSIDDVKSRLGEWGIWQQPSSRMVQVRGVIS